MSFKTSFQFNQVVSNRELVDEFQCGMSGGMRHSSKTNTLCLISDNSKSRYHDKWIDNVLHYTGMGITGNQDLTYRQNKTLAESKTNGVIVHLFEVLIPTQYIYRGIVKLASAPYQGIQKDMDGNPRKVWLFPIQLTNDKAIDYSLLKQSQDLHIIRASKLSLRELEHVARESQKKSLHAREVTTITYIRNAYVAEYTRRMAQGKCQLCGLPAPFIKKDGYPYLESHHIVWLSEGGFDTIQNTTALCPNCHKKMHVLNLPEDITKLMAINSSLYN